MHDQRIRVRNQALIPGILSKWIPGLARHEGDGNGVLIHIEFQIHLVGELFCDGLD